MKKYRCSDCKGGEILRLITPSHAFCLKCLGKRLGRKVTIDALQSGLLDHDIVRLTMMLEGQTRDRGRRKKRGVDC